MRRKRIVWLAAAMVLVCRCHAFAGEIPLQDPKTFVSEEPRPGREAEDAGQPEVKAADEGAFFTSLDQAEEVFILESTPAPPVQAKDDGEAVRKAASDLREGLEARRETIGVTVTCQSDSDAEGLYSRIRETAFTLGPDEAENDYLRYCVEYDDPGPVLMEAEGDSLVYHWDTSWRYYASLLQERELSDEIDAVINGLDLDGLSPRERVERIYRFVTDNAGFDYQEAPASHSAYTAMFSRCAVCQGFSLLFARLLTRAGVPNRILTGHDHMWNLVGVDGLFYNCDVTWEITKGDGSRYLLQCDRDFESDHFRDEWFGGEEFRILYPPAQYSLY